MQLNCRPGDLAVIVRTEYRPQLLGRVATCVRLHNSYKMDADGLLFINPTPGPRWVVEGSIVDLKTIADRNLKPIRHDGGEDEMPRIAGRPQERERV